LISKKTRIQKNANLPIIQQPQVRLLSIVVFHLDDNGLKQIFSPDDQLLLPVLALIGMDVKGLRSLGQGALPLDHR